MPTLSTTPRTPPHRPTWRRDQRGASAVEYGLLVAAIAAVIVTIAFALGGVVEDTLFHKTCDVIANEGAAGPNDSCT